MADVVAHCALSLSACIGTLEIQTFRTVREVVEVEFVNNSALCGGGAEVPKYGVLEAGQTYFGFVGEPWRIACPCCHSFRAGVLCKMVSLLG